MRDETNDQPNPHDAAPAENEPALDLIAGARRGDAASVNELIKVIYPELQRRARWFMTKERTGHTFGTSGSELVQKVMERILESGGQIFEAANTEGKLIGMLTRRMRFILVDYARSARKHEKPSPRSRVPFDDVEPWAKDPQVNVEEVLRTDEALARLAEVDAQAAQAIELRIFGGLTNKEAAGAMGLSVSKFRRTFYDGKAFLKELMEQTAASSSQPPPRKRK